MNETVAQIYKPKHKPSRPSPDLYKKLMKKIIRRKELLLQMDGESLAGKLIGVGRDLKKIMMLQNKMNIDTPRDISELIATIETFIAIYGMSFGIIYIQNLDYDATVKRANETISTFLEETAATEIVEGKNIRDMIAKLDTDGSHSTKDDSTSTDDFPDSSL